MSDRDFEKQVQQRLQGLQFEPGEAVWSGVAAGIGRRRRRRVILLWFFAGLLFLGTGGYYWYRSGKINPSPRQQAVTRQPATGLPRESSAAGKEPGQGSRSESPAHSGSDILPGAFRATEPPQKRNESRSTEIRNAKISSIRGLPTRQQHILDGYAKYQDGAVSPSENHPSSGRPITGTSLNEAENRIALRFSPVMAPASGLPEPVVTVPPYAISSEYGGATPPDSGRPKKHPAAQWAWGFTGGAGVSRLTDGGLFSLGTHNARDVASSQLNFPGGSAFVPPPSPIKSGVSYTAGLFAERKLSKRLSLGAGLQYQYLSSRMYAGQRVDSSRQVNNSYSFSTVNNYYQNTQSGTYVNKFHFLSVPVQVKWTINRGTPELRLSLGAAYQYLLASNSLHYDQLSGIYYQDNHLLNRHQVAINSGLSLQLFGKATHPLELGPALQFAVRPLTHAGPESQKRFFTAGLQAQWYLHR